MSYLLCCYDQIPNEKLLKEVKVCFGSQFEEIQFIMTSSDSFQREEAERDETNASLHIILSVFSFIHHMALVYGMLSLILGWPFTPHLNLSAIKDKGIL